MQNYRISLNDLPPEGKEFQLDDPAVWQEPMKEFGMECRVSKPLSATITVLPTDGGWLVRGSLAGEVVLPCSRCDDDAPSSISTRFEDFEELPGDDDFEGPGGGASLSGVQAQDEDAESRLVFVNNVPMLDLAAICWEELILALPVLNLWAICHAALRAFPSGPQERILWVMLAVFVPVLGGITYLVFGLKRASKPQTP